MLSSSRVLIVVSLTILIISTFGVADWRQDAEAVHISGGENHTLVLTQNKFAWACGDNSDNQLGLGPDALGYQPTLVRVHGPNDVNYLEDINDVDAGYMHSLALDINGLVWAWGDNAVWAEKFLIFGFCPAIIC